MQERALGVPHNVEATSAVHTKICEDNMAFGIEKNVFKLQVSIEDSNGVEKLERKDNLSRNELRKDQWARTSEI